MSRSNRIARLLAGVIACAAPVPAMAQQVIVCFTLHNDLANFDRRARSVDRFADHMDNSRAEMDQVLGAYKEHCLGQPLNILSETCTSLTSKVYDHRASLDQLERQHARSRIGGADPVRLAIIAEMRRNGCLYRAENDLYDRASGRDARQLPPRSPVRVRG